MKRIICLILICLIITFVFAGCEETPVGEFKPTANETSARFCEIGRERLASRTDNDVLEDAIYYVDVYSNIVYVYLIDWDANATRGMMTVLYDTEGVPMTLEEFMEESN